MRITKISVKNLFGMFDHEIPLNQDSRITIIHGPNGVGKTVLLNMLHGLFHYEYELLRQTPFEQFHVEFENGEFITVEKEKHEVRIDNNDIPFNYIDILINYEDSTGKDYIPFRPSFFVKADAFKLVEELHPGLTLVNMPYESHSFYWVSPADGIIFTMKDMLRKYPSLHNELYGEMPDWFASIQQAASLEFVSTTRLRRDIVGYEEVIMQYKREQREDFFITSSPYAIHDLQRDIKRRLRELGVTTEEFEKLKTEGFAELNTEIDALTAQLAKFDTAAAEFEDVSALLEEHRAEQMDERESIHLKLERSIKRKDFALATILLLDLINERFLFKSLDLRVDDINMLEVGFFRFIADDGDNSFLSGSALSSGEQHLFVLYYYLLFKVQPDTLVLIDEPELSMNVVWQRNFLKDLQRIVKLRKFDVLVATHSPQIIHDKWDWMVALGEPVR